MKLPTDFERRFELNNEVHARPPEALVTPTRITYIALLSQPEARDEEIAHLTRLCGRYGVNAPGPGATHFSADLGPFRIKWERHTEFSRYMFIARSESDDPFAASVVASLPSDWSERLSGRTIVAAQVAILKSSASSVDHDALSSRHFAGNTLIGSRVAANAAIALTDMRIHADGMSRALVLDNGLQPRVAGRIVQRLLEIETYRMTALLALPVARDLGPFLSESDRELTRITTEMVAAGRDEEPNLLERLTTLQAEIERRYAVSEYRFSAAQAYYDLVRSRISELREERIEGLQTFNEFTERRLSPAMGTCRSAAGRLEALSERVARSTQMLSTRVDIARERQNQLLLETMARRASMQLRLQQTVEGLSIAAIAYYIVGLVGYGVKGLNSLGLRINADLAMGFAIPVVVAILFFGLKAHRRRISKF